MGTEGDSKHPTSPVKGSLKTAGRGVLWPARRFVDPRIQGLLDHIDARHEELVQQLESGPAAEALEELQALEAAKADAEVEALTVIGRSLDDILRETERIGLLLEQPPDERFIHNVADLTPEVARFLNYALGSTGFSAQAGLWFNPPVLVLHHEASVEVQHVNERIAEVPYVFRALAELSKTARVLDVGAAESTVALSLASLGYEVTAVDPRPYPLSHPRLQLVESRIEDWDTSDTFDAVVCLSTIEHLGLRAYGQEDHADADVAAMRRMRELTAPGGLLVLTAPFGTSFHVDEFQRTYDHEHLDALLVGWDVEDLTILQRTSPTCWEVDGRDAEPVGEGPGQVALVTARRSS